MTVKYRTPLFVLAVVLGACGPQTVAPSPSPILSPTAPAVFKGPTPPPGLPAAIPATATADRTWHLLPDGLGADPIRINVRFQSDPAMGAPFLVANGGGAIQLRPAADGSWTADIPLAFAPGPVKVEVNERLASGGYATVATVSVMVSHPEYVVWTLDFEGDASGDAEMANTAAIADGLKIPMSVFWNPRVWTTSQVSAERQDAMLRWTKDRLAKGDEVALHLHMWTDYVTAAGLTPRLSPSWAGRGDGYDVPMTAYPEADQKTLIDYGVKLMTEHGLPKPTSFRAGGDIGDAATLRALVAAGFDADCTAVAKDYPAIGRVPYPWSLPVGAQPYHPAATDANVVGDLPLLEAPTIGGNTYAYTVNSIQPQIRANLALLAPAGAVAMARKTMTAVSHPGTIVPAERAAIEALFGAFSPLRYDTDSGPVRFVTLGQLAKAYGR